ncbi:MAG: S-layer homology domain-containing protein, partial [Limnochordia bacterium]
MRFKKFALVLAIVLMAGTLTSALASPFADVPADHWAYDAVVELAAAGLIEGYPDGTYGGARMMTRYEAAMVFARALQRLESQIAANNLLPELDRIKAELMAEIEAAKAAAAAAAEKEPIETTVVEKVIVDKDVDPEALARIRANEIANEALAGDMAYLEARMLGLIDGIRYDLDQLKDRPVEVPEVEVPSMEEIEELIAKRIEESILEAAAAAKETTIIERVVATTPELSKEDVEFIAEALIRAQVSRLELLINENRAMIAALSEWVDEIDTDVAAVKEDLAGVKEDVAGLQDAVSVLEKVQFSGKLGLNAEKKVGETELKFSQTGSLNLNVKASEATNVKAFVDWTLTPFEWETILKKYGVEVTSSTPLKSLLVGYVAKGKLSPFNYVLSTDADYGFGGVANVEIIDGLTFDLFAGQKAIDDTEFDAAAALSYKFMDELGVRIKGKATKPHSGMFKDNYAAGIGLFGEVAGIKYTGDFAMDFSAKDKNYIGVGTVETSFGDLKLD